jgi:hypothetical protein
MTAAATGRVVWQVEATGTLARPGRDSQLTVTLVRIQGWMRHSKRCRPGASDPVVSVPPAGTPVAKRMPGVPHSGTGVNPSRAFKKPMQPPPKLATSVNVWNSPPRF